MSTITEFLALIAAASRGDEVRDSIIGALQLCYDDGKAGAVDLAARQGLEGVRNVNEEQESAIAVLQAAVKDLQDGGGDEQITGQTSTDVPTLIVDYGYENFTAVASNTTARHSITFAKTFTEAPVVLAVLTYRSGANVNYVQVTTAPINSTITTTGFDLVVGNKYTQAVSPTVLWVAFQPTVTTIDTEIIVPSTDDLTQEQIDSLIGLLE